MYRKRIVTVPRYLTNYRKCRTCCCSRREGANILLFALRHTLILRDYGEEPKYINVRILDNTNVAVVFDVYETKNRKRPKRVRMKRNVVVTCRYVQFHLGGDIFRRHRHRRTSASHVHYVDVRARV